MFSVSQPNHYTSTIDISAESLMTASSKTTLATVTVVWQSDPWAISTGIMFSTLKNHKFTNAAVINEGVPLTDSNGKNLTNVIDSVKRPAVLLPVVMLHYQVPAFPALMASAGAGLNLGTTTAEFVAGPSLKVFGVVISPLAHFGRESELTNGVTLGDKLGVNAPDPPTTSHWVTRFAVAFSYALPTP
jgi:hypothetical protein